MNDIASPAVPRLWTTNGFTPDPWCHAEDVSRLDQGARIILPLQAYLALDTATRSGASNRIGVLIQPGEEIAPLLSLIHDIPVICLAFPAFNDGRSYSRAQLLRERHGYRGTLRASGDVLIDQIPLMLRTGFDAFEVSNETALKRLEEGRKGGLPYHYQPAARPEPGGAGYAWRRLPAA